MRLLPFKFADGFNLRIRDERFFETKKQLKTLLNGEKHLHTKTIAKDVMFSHKLKAYNQKNLWKYILNF